MENYQKEIKNLQKKWDKKFNLIQQKFNSDVSKRKLTKTSERNELWDKKYKKSWDINMKKCKEESIKTWRKYHNENNTLK